MERLSKVLRPLLNSNFIVPDAISDSIAVELSELGSRLLKIIPSLMRYEQAMCAYASALAYPELNAEFSAKFGGAWAQFTSVLQFKIVARESLALAELVDDHTGTFFGDLEKFFQEFNDYLNRDAAMKRYLDRPDSELLRFVNMSEYPVPNRLQSKIVLKTILADSVSDQEYVQAETAMDVELVRISQDTEMTLTVSQYQQSLKNEFGNGAILNMFDKYIGDMGESLVYMNNLDATMRDDLLKHVAHIICEENVPTNAKTFMFRAPYRRKAERVIFDGSPITGEDREFEMTDVIRFILYAMEETNGPDNTLILGYQNLQRWVPKEADATSKRFLIGDDTFEPLPEVLTDIQCLNGMVIDMSAHITEILGSVSAISAIRWQIPINKTAWMVDLAYVLSQKKYLDIVDNDIVMVRLLREKFVKQAYALYGGIVKRVMITEGGDVFPTKLSRINKLTVYNNCLRMFDAVLTAVYGSDDTELHKLKKIVFDSSVETLIATLDALGM